MRSDALGHNRQQMSTQALPLPSIASEQAVERHDQEYVLADDPVRLYAQGIVPREWRSRKASWRWQAPLSVMLWALAALILGAFAGLACYGWFLVWNPPVTDLVALKGWLVIPGAQVTALIGIMGVRSCSGHLWGRRWWQASALVLVIVLAVAGWWLHGTWIDAHWQDWVPSRSELPTSVR